MRNRRQASEAYPNWPPYADRYAAGRVLAALLATYRDREDVLVLGLPRGGVPVAFEVARALKAPLDVFLVRKLGVPNHQELAMGAIASGGMRVLNEDVVEGLNISAEIVERVTLREQQELTRRERAFRGSHAFPSVKGRTVLLIDDGIATGATMRAAAEAVRRMQPARLVVAIPVASSDTCRQFRGEVDGMVCALTPDSFRSVGDWYADFSPTSDEEVCALLRDASGHLQKLNSNKEPVAHEKK
jgi:putative phosphoribosyl transferase